MANNLDALNPEYWAPRMQVQLEKALVGKQICSFEIQMPDGDKFHRPYHGDLTAGTYTRNATTSGGGAVTATDVTTTDEFLLVDTAKYVSFKIDRLDEVQNHRRYKLANKLASRGGYKLRDQIDTAIFTEYANAGIEMYAADVGDVGATTPITVTTTNIFRVFSGTRKKLEKANITDEGDFFGCISPDVAEVAKRYLVGTGNNIMDKVIPNGYRGQIDSFAVYVTNNLAETTVSAVTTQHQLFGKKGATDLVIQAQPTTEKKDLPQNADGSIQLATQWIVWTLYGKKTFAEGAVGLVDVNVNGTSF